MKVFLLIVVGLLAVSCKNESGESFFSKEQDVGVDIEPDGIRLVESVTTNSETVVIPYQKYELENGLTVILHADHSDPLVHVDVTYHVGSAREEKGKSGFAHFFEHMMFQGSENVGDEQHFKIVTEAGGTMNGTTSTDRTNYYQTVPANQLEKVLWLESDRMGYFLDAVTQEKFEVQRDTVKNERGQRVDNRPYGRVDERISQALFPDGHPYSWPVIGYTEDLDRVGLDDLKEFFSRWYGPNNAVLTIGGDFEEKKALEWVEKYFGSIPRGPEVSRHEKLAFEIQDDRYISMEDNVHLPLLVMSYPTVHFRHEDEAPLDVLSSILGAGKTSLFYKNLIKNQLAVDAGVTHYCAELACKFELYALPHPGSDVTLSTIEKVIRDTLVEFEQRGVEADDLLMVKAEMESGFIFGLQSVAGKVRELAFSQTLFGDPDYIQYDITRYNKVREKDVMRVFKEYLKNQHSVILSVVPNGRISEITAPDSFYPPAKHKELPVMASTNTTTGEQILRPKDTFDRSIMPKAGINKTPAVPAIWRHSSPDGMEVLGASSTETPTTSMMMRIPAGHYYSTKDKAGTASLLAAMLNESTMQRSAEEMSKQLRKLGSSVSISAGASYLNVDINTLSKNLNQTLALVFEKLTQPAWMADEFERVKQTAVEGILQSKKDPSFLAQNAARVLLYGDNIAAMPVRGSETSVKNIRLVDLKNFYAAYLKPQGGQLIVVSEKPKTAILEALTVFDGLEGSSKALDLEFPRAEPKAGMVYLVNKDDAAQSSIIVGKRSLERDINGEFFRSSLMNFVLGGTFNSRINLNLREDKGFTYGARSYFSGDKLIGSFLASTEVRADVTDQALIELTGEIQRYSESGTTHEELIFMRNAVSQRDALKYETPSAKLRFLAQILEYDLSPGFVKERAEIIQNISKDEINALAKKHLSMDQMFMLVVGDAATVKPHLEHAGYQVVDFDI